MTDWTNSSSISTDWTGGSSISTDWTKGSSTSTKWGSYDSRDFSNGFVLLQIGDVVLLQDGGKLGLQ